MNTADERFDEKWVENENGCWIWTADKHKKGYGHFRHEGRMVRAHRYAWVRRNGPIPPGMQIGHFLMNRKETCDQCSRSCVNPEHLELVTSAENTRRSELVIETGRKNGIAGRKQDLPEGVSPIRKRFRAQIRNPITGKVVYLGAFATPEEAHRRYLFARGGYVYAQYTRLPGMSEVEHAS